MNEISTVPADRPRGWLNVLARLWLLRPVAAAPSTGAGRVVLIMAAVWLAAWAAIDRWQSEPDPQFISGGIPLLAWYALAILGLAALLRRSARPAPAFELTLVLALGSVPLPLLFAGVLAPYLDPRWILIASALIGVYLLLYLVRGLRALTGQSQRAAGCAGLLFVAVFCWATDRLDAIPDVWSPQQTQTADSGDRDVDGESLLFDQAARIDQSLSTVSRDSSPRPRAFFLGFAGVGEQKVFAQEIGLASRVLGERYDIDGRRLSLINDERDLERAPLATVAGLKYALLGLASRMNLEQDVLFLSISSHGAQDPAIVVSNSQLPLNDMTGEDLAEALSDSGIRWRVIIISACYAGGFLDYLRDPQTIVITAAAADRTSFGCSNDSDLTYFGEAFYRDALPGARSLRAAFEAAKSAITARELREHVEPSLPAGYFGKAMEEKLASMNPAPP